MAVITHVFQLKEGLGYEPTGNPTITGELYDGGTIQADTSTIQSAYGIQNPTYAWYRNNVLIGTTTQSILLTQADVGAVYKVQVSFQDSQSANWVRMSLPSAPVANRNDAPTGTVTINGTRAQNSTLTISTSGISDIDGLGPFSYQWQRNGVDIPGATATTYLLTQADVGTEITAVVSYTDGFGAEESLQATTGTIANVNDAPTGTVTITGTVAEDETLTASNNLADIDGMGPVTYQWLRGGVEIPGATSSIYVLSQADVGQFISVTAEYTDQQGTLETVTSSPTTQVLNVNDPLVGSLTITGTAEEGQTLTANATISDEDGLGSISYQWKRGGTNISGATASTYTLTQADVGSTITVTASYTDQQGTPESITSSPTSAVANVNSAPTGSVTINGSATEGSTLTANTSTVADADGLGAFSYQWKKDGVNVPGATSSTYTLTQADVGGQFSVQVSWTDTYGTNESLTSAQTSPVANLNDAPQGVPTISGTQTQGQTLTGNASGITDADGLGAFSYQWTRNGSNIVGATGTTYTLTQADVGSLIRFVVSYTDGQGTPETVTSAPTSAIANVNDAPSGNVTITGTFTENQTLTANTSGISDPDGLGSFSYQWRRNGVAISGATNSTYTLGDADVGTAISLTVTYTDGQGTVESLTSTSSAPVVNINDNPTGSISISGSALVGSTLTSSNTIADADGLGAFSYQWIRGTSTVISGATSSSYVVQQADKGSTLKLQITYTDGQGTVETVTSGNTSVVNSPNSAPTGTVTFTNTGTEPGDVLTSSVSLSDANGLGTLSYQWTRNNVNISGATGTTYTITTSDIGTTLRLKVSYVDGDGYSETVTSSTTLVAQYTAFGTFLSATSITSGGYRVALSSNGNYAVVGNPSANSATVLLRSGDNWNVQQTLTGSGNFGIDVGIDDTGSTIVVGANLLGSSQGAAYAYVRSGSTWSGQTLPILNPATGHGWGQGVAISGDGQWIIVGGPGVDIPQTNGGQVQSFSRSVDTFSWDSHVAITVASGDGYAHRLALNFDGQVASATSLYTAEVQYARRNTSGGWFGATLVADGPAGYGDDIKLSNDGLWMVIGATEDGGSTPGKVYVYQRTAITSSFSLRATINDPAGTNLNKFGEGVGISSDGSVIVVGAQSDNKAYVFVRLVANGSSWGAGPQLTGATGLGQCVDVSADGTVCAVGYPGGVRFYAR